MRGEIFVISAPSGAGKTTLLRRVMSLLPGLAFSVSHTTRGPRPGEREGVDYYFVDQETFLAMQARGEFLEWAEVHSNYYGTSRETVEKSLASGLDLILDIDVQGADQIREKLGGGATFIFIAPPSWEELRRRLTGRGTDSADTVELRIRNAWREMAAVERYDYVIVNGDIDEATDSLRAIMVARRSLSRRAPSGRKLSIPVPPGHV